MSAVTQAAAPARKPAPALPPAAPAQPTPGGLLRTPIGALFPSFSREFFWVCFYSAVANLLMLVPVIYMLQVFDRVMFSGNLDTLAAVTLLMVAMMVLMGFAEWVRSRLMVRAGSRFDNALSRRIFDAAFLARLSNDRGNAIQPLQDLGTLRQFLTGNGVFAVADAPWALIFIAVLFLMHPLLGWLSVAFLVIQLIVGFIASRYTKRRTERSQALAVESTQFLQSKLRNAETIEALGMSAALREQWLGLNERQKAEQELSSEATARVQSLVKWMQYTQQALMLSLGAWLVIAGQISAGAMIAANALMGNALRPVGLLVQAWSQFIGASAAFHRLNALLAKPRVEALSPPATQLKGQITLRGLKAMAPGREQPILDGLDAEFRTGEVVAIIGPSGAGKSTLARCLLGIWPKTEGEVLIDGQPLQSWPREVLGPYLGYLPQDIELFEGSIAENIARFTAASSDLVIEAAKAAGIHEMVLRQPQGYDTPIGEAGALLSGGQRQRLGLARALLGWPIVVVLDEPSANLDDVGQAALLKAIATLKERGSTVFMILHQPHLLAAADRALILEAGRIKQLGNVVRAPAPAQVPAKP